MIWKTNHTFSAFQWCKRVLTKIIKLRKLHFLILLFRPILRLPFNWKTPGGYFIALCAECIAVFVELFSSSTMLCFSVGSCWLFITIVRDITNDLTYLNCNKISASNIQTKKVQFYHIIEFYSDAKQLSFQTTYFDPNWVWNVVFSFFLQVSGWVQQNLQYHNNHKLLLDTHSHSELTIYIPNTIGLKFRLSLLTFCNFPFQIFTNEHTFS